MWLPSLPDIDPIYLFSAAIVGVILVIGDAVYLLAFGSDTHRRTANRRLSQLDKSGDRESAIVQLRRDRGIDDRFHAAPWLAPLSRLVTQSGVTIGVWNLAALCAAAAAVAFLALFLWRDLIAGCAGAAFAGAVLPILVLRHLRKRRWAKFTDQFPEALDLMVRSLRAGHPVPAAIHMAARELADPLGSEFGMVEDEITYGLDLETAMRNMNNRVGQEDLPLFVTSVAIQASSGGNLTEILANLCDVVRMRVKMRRKIRALSSEGRASAMILTSIPIILFIVINWMSPAFYGAHWSNPWLGRGLAVGAGWMLIGNLVMRRMINFKF